MTPRSEGEPAVLHYAAIECRAPSRMDLLVWLLPLWCALVVAFAYWPVRHNDDGFWYVAIAVPLVASVACVIRRRRALALYSLAVGVAVGAVAGVLLPIWNRGN